MSAAHLPPGVPPGRQTRRGQTGRTASAVIAPFFIVGGLLFAVVFAFVGIAVAGASAGFGLAFGGGGAVFGLLFAGVGVAVVRGGTARWAKDLVVAVDQPHVQRGDVLRAKLLQGAGPDVELGLLCQARHDEIVRTNDSRNQVTRVGLAWELWQPAAGGEVAFTVPPDGAYSYEGQVVSFAWLVQARRRSSKRPSRPAPVWVSP